MRPFPLAVALVLLAGAAACRGGKSPTYTLYRTEAVVGDTARIHVATFDAVDDEENYNRDGCERTRELYQIQPTNRARFWCEAGVFKAKK